ITFRDNNYPDNIDGDNLYAANDMVKRNNAQLYCPRYLNVSNEINTNYNGQNIGIDDNWNIMKTQSTQNINLQFIQVVPEDCILKIAVSHDGNPAYQYEPQVFDFCDLFLTTNIPQTVSNVINIRLFPNPAENELNIEIRNATGRCTVEIFNMLNQKIYCSEIENKSSIDISNFAKGIYLAKIYSENFTRTIKFIKQ
ncbi:MAG: T9SS type A sorting domain-containing protein, partial [Bacteroidota bacterium]|nr:T9SS type A sorting domain-containing protein [Bacteroidota bacterium]